MRMPAWETGSDGALAEKIRSRLEVLDRPGVGRVRASFGVTAFAGNESSESIELTVIFLFDFNGLSCYHSSRRLFHCLSYI